MVASTEDTLYIWSTMMVLKLKIIFSLRCQYQSFTLLYDHNVGNLKTAPSTSRLPPSHFL